MSVKIAQISDTHLFANPDTEMRGVVPWQSLKTVLFEVKSMQPHLLLLTGDLAEAGEPEAYDRLVELVAPLNVPAYWIPGNHDRLDVLSSRLDRPQVQSRRQLAIAGWQIMFLDSTCNTARFGEGELSGDTLTDLDTRLSHTSDPTAIVLHHHPIPVGIDWLDTIGVRNATDLLAILNRHDCVKLVLFGHVHLEVDRARNGIQFYGVPSTCTQVLAENATQRERLPGFRWLELHPDRTYRTRVIRSSS